MNGQMIWFNADKGHGFIRTDAGERLHVAAEAFRPGEVPSGRCGGREVVFEQEGHGEDARAVNVAFVPESAARRARTRHARAGRSL